MSRLDTVGGEAGAALRRHWQSGMAPCRVLLVIQRAQVSVNSTRLPWQAREASCKGATFYGMCPVFKDRLAKAEAGSQVLPGVAETKLIKAASSG